MMRTDEHRPSVIVPENYQFVAYDYIGGSDLGAIMALKAQREILNAHMTRTNGKWANHEHGGTCHICGAMATYLCIFYNEKLNDYIRTGEDCAQKLDMGYDDMNPFRRAISDAREAKAGKAKAQAILADAGLSRAWDFGPDHSDRTIEWKYEELTINDMVNKLIKYGSVSEKQIAFLHKLLAQLDNRAVLEARRQTEHDAAADCPEGRVTISGTVLTVKDVEGYAGEPATKILVQSEEGFKVWGSRFANAEKGQQIKFVATVTRSDKDSKFGFFKRPLLWTPPLSKAAKKAITKLGRIRKTIEYGSETYTAHATLDQLIEQVKLEDVEAQS